MKRHPFNLIELMLAMGVIVIGLVSVMALFPIGANANRDAAAGNYAAQTAEQTLSLLANYLTDPTDPTRWGTFISGGTPSIKLCDDSTLPAYIKSWDGCKPADCTLESNLNVGTPKTIYQKDPNDFQQGLLIRNGHENNSGEYLTDFEAMAFVWQEEIDIDGTNKVGLQYGTCLKIEVTWPAQLPYARRQKVTYQLEVFNPNL